MKTTFNVTVGLILLLVLGLLPSCGGKSNSDYQEIAKFFAADESLSPVINEELDAYRMRRKDLKIDTLYTNEHDAVNMLVDRKTWLVFTTRQLTPNEQQILSEKRLKPKTMPLAYDGMALIVNKDNPDSLITAKDFARIISGEISCWNELDASLPNDTIRVAFDNPKSSTVRFCVDSILRGKEMKTTGNIRAVQTSREVISYVEKHKNAIGIVGSMWLNDQRDSTNATYGRNIKVMSVSKADEATPYNSYDPSQYNIAYNNYPFIRTVYAIVTDPRSQGEARGLGNFCILPDGQLVFFQAGMFPARAEYSVRDVVIH
ncbi:MAG: substrate-binding domain-containing protein [Prevotella sp.]|nr:substrate-binding domain-containing protein [Prevotella sp.]